MPKLIIIEKGEERAFELVNTVTTIGRSAKCDISLDDLKCSRNHCTIELSPDDGGYALIDEDSSNGTLVNGKRAKLELLAVGDLISIGAVRIYFGQKIDDAELKIPEGDLKGGASPEKPKPVAKPEEKKESNFFKADELPPPPPPIAPEKPQKPAAADITTPFLLLGMAGEVNGVEFPVGEEVSFGRKRSCSIVLKDEKVSGEHAKILREDGGFVLVDLESTNGTWVGRSRVNKTRLQHGMLFRIGKSVFAFKNRGLALEKSAEAADDESFPSQEQFESVDVKPLLEREQNYATVLAGILLGLLLVVIVIAGFFVVKDLFRKETLPARAANFVQENWSFEDAGRSAEGLQGWKIASASWDVVDSAASHGKRSLSLAAGGEAVSRQSFSITSLPQGGALYVSADVRVDSADSAAGVRLAFISAEDAAYREYAWATPVYGRRGEFQKSSGVIIPPRKASKFEVSLVNVSGSGPAYFDSIEVFALTDCGAEISKALSGASVEEIDRVAREVAAALEASRDVSLDGNIELSFAPRGTFGVRHEGARVLWEAGVLVNEGGKSDAAARQALAPARKLIAANDDGSLECETKIFSLSRQVKYRVDEAVRKEGARAALDYNFSMPKDSSQGVAFCFEFSTTAQIWNEAEKSADEIVWSGADSKLSVSWTPVSGGPVVRELGAGLVRVVIPLGEPVGEKGQYGAQVIFCRTTLKEKRVAGSDLERIRTLMRDDMFSEARKLAEDMKRRSVGDQDNLAKANEITAAIDSLESEMRGDLVKMKEDIERFSNYRILPIFSSYARRAGRAFPSTLGADVETMAKELERGKKEREISASSAAAADLVKNASMYQARGEYARAEAAWREVTANFPGTPDARTAEEKLRIIEAGRTGEKKKDKPPGE